MEILQTNQGGGIEKAAQSPAKTQQTARPADDRPPAREPIRESDGVTISQEAQDFNVAVNSQKAPAPPVQARQQDQPSQPTPNTEVRVAEGDRDTSQTAQAPSQEANLQIIPATTEPITPENEPLRRAVPAPPAAAETRAENRTAENRTEEVEPAPAADLRERGIRRIQQNERNSFTRANNQMRQNENILDETV